MKNLVVAFLFCLTSTIANAQQSNWSELPKPLLCGPLTEVITILTEQYKEYPLFIGNDGVDHSKYSFFVNRETGTWTMIQFGSAIACILGMGSDAKFANLPKSGI